MVKNAKTILCGLAICPNTPLELLYPYLPDIDLIQILTLDPRTGEKANLDQITERLIQLLNQLHDSGQEKLISIDGSMTFELASHLKNMRSIGLYRVVLCFHRIPLKRP